MALRIFFTSIILLVNLVIQSTLFDYIEIVNIKPNTAVLIIISFAILRGDVSGAIIGFFAGLFQDIFFGNYIGLNAFLYMLIGYISAKPFKDFYKENYALPLLLSGVSTIFYEFSIYFTSFFFRGKLNIAFYLNKIILPSTVYTVLLSIPVYMLIYSLNKKIESIEKPKQKMF